MSALERGRPRIGGRLHPRLAPATAREGALLAGAGPIAGSRGQPRVTLCILGMLAGQSLGLLLVGAGTLIGRAGALACRGGQVLGALALRCRVLVVGGGVLLVGARSQLRDLAQQPLNASALLGPLVSRGGAGALLA